MNNQTTMNRGGRGGIGAGGGGRGKNPSKPPRFSKNSATQSQVILFQKNFFFIKSFSSLG